MSKTWEYLKLSDLEKTGKELLEAYPKERIYAFVGKMGAGKTTFIKALCCSLGVEEEVSSPTFSLVNEYRGSVEKTIFHFDFYRIETETEAYDIGLEEYLDSGNYCFIEWPDKIDSLLPPSFVLIKIKELEGKREIESNLILD
jgi:tRNA threonylcarbamoyladenosine biosynthesis protein TsaE|tara:strand:+ start:1652 stop:2080 length:429 start_codon:yes stop_codon:yes gene_type:complete